MHYGNIKNCDIANGEGVRVSLFVSGCRNHCPGCFQPETWDFNYGQEFTKDTADKIIAMLNEPYIDGLTILGGEPFEPENQEVIHDFLACVKVYAIGKTVWMYTGYALDKDLMPSGSKYTQYTDDILSMIDVLVDGRFEIDKKNISLRFRGSENQRILDVRKSLAKKSPVIYMY